MVWIVWGVLGILGILFIVYAVVPNVWTRILRHAMYKLPSEINQLALTFDDGPHPDYTPRLLDCLRELNTHATFFVIVEKALAHPEIIRRMIAEGHDVQIHGYSHAMVPFLLPLRTVRQFKASQRKLNEIFGIATMFYRPTWGLCNLWTLIRLRSLQLVTWSIMVGDWRRTPAAVLHSRILAKLHPGAILVLHDHDETPGAEPGAPNSVIELMQPLIETLWEKGYIVGSLRQLAVHASAPKGEI